MSATTEATNVWNLILDEVERSAARMTDRYRVTGIEDDGQVAVQGFNPEDIEQVVLPRLRDAVIDIDDDVAVLRYGGPNGEDVILGAIRKPGEPSPNEEAIRATERMEHAVFDVARFGAVRGRGMSPAERTRNTQAWNDAAAEALGGTWPWHADSRGTVVAKGEYEVDPGIELACNVDAAQASLVVYGADGPTVPAIFAGTRANENLWGMKLHMPKVRPNSSSTARGNGSVGIEFCNTVSCDIAIPEIAYFGIGTRFTARQARGNVSNRVQLGTLYDNLINLSLETIGTDSWVNEQKFFGGHFVVSTAHGPKLSGMRHIRMWSSNTNMINSNVFYAPNLEGNGPEYHVEIRNGRFNSFHDARWEVPGAYNADIRCHANSRANLFLHGYSPEKVNIINESGATSNYSLSYLTIMHIAYVTLGNYTTLGNLVGRYRVPDGQGGTFGVMPIYDSIS